MGQNEWSQETFERMGEALRRLWPDMSLFSASYAMWRYIDAKPGQSGFDWTREALDGVAREYVSDFGEQN